MLETWNYNPFLDFLDNIERVEMEGEHRNNRARSRSPRARIIEMALREEEERLREFMRDEPIIEMNRRNARSMPIIQRWRRMGVQLLAMFQHAQQTLTYIANGRLSTILRAQRLISNDRRTNDGLLPVQAPRTPETPPGAKGKGKGKGKGKDTSSEEEDGGEEG